MALKRFWKLNIFVWAKHNALLFPLCLSLALFAPLAVAGATDIYAFSQEAEKQRFLSLTKSLRCLVCQNQSLADSDADLANDLRKKIYSMIQEKKSDDEIQQFLVSRYGQFILFSPPLQRSTVLLWGFPMILFIMMVGGLVLSVRKSSR